MLGYRKGSDDLLEMPDMFERYMKLGEAAFENEEYEEARDCFEEAYSLKNDPLANLSLVRSLTKLKEFKSAYAIILENKRIYIEEKSNQSVYFEVLLQLTYFLEIEKLLAQKSLVNQQDFEKAYRIAKDYHLMVYKEKFKKLEIEVTSLVDYPSFQQGKYLKKLIFLPKEIVISLAKELLVNPDVSLFSKNELVQHLVQLRLTEPVEVLTYDNKVVSFVGSETLTLNEAYQNNQVLKEVSDYFEQHNPSLKKEVLSTIKIHIGCLYPFQDEVMKPVQSWVEEYLEKYGQGSHSITDSKVQNIQERLDEEVLKLMSFD
ncbi:MULTISPECIES: tetratricopeptide repeat protein [Vagococcus]|uniref:tetratricopeptide repeat protein n=1 Tax=Vagococcus TaxID=2737 RepID=UPI002FCB3EC0